VREDAIVESVNRLLADKGFDLMTVDEVAADVGIAKASLYKHFPSKEALAAAAMVRLAQRTLAAIDQQAARPEATAMQRLVAVTRWALERQVAGEIDATLPPEVVLYTIFARACDPVPAFLKAAGQHGNAQIVEWVLSTCLHGLHGPASPAAR